MPLTPTTSSPELDPLFIVAGFCMLASLAVMLIATVISAIHKMRDDEHCPSHTTPHQPDGKSPRKENNE